MRSLFLRRISANLFHFKIEGFFPKMDIQHPVPGLDLPLLKTFSPAVGKLALKVVLEILHFRICQGFPELYRGAAHQLPVPDFHRRDGAQYFCLNAGILLFVKVWHEVPVVDVVLFYRFPDAVLIIAHIDA